MNRLRAFRDIEGINQGDLAEMLGISTPMISAVESGRRGFNGDLTALGYGNDRLTLPDMSEPIHRARASTSAAAKKKAKELLRLSGEVFGELISATPKAPDILLRRRAPVANRDDIEDAAGEMRAILAQSESGPIQNLTSLVERAGVCLVPMPNLPGLDGLSAWVASVPVIGLDPNVPGDRFRYSLGHECGHLMFHDRRHDSVENEANLFAGSLLIPPDDFDAAMPDKPKLSDFIALKRSWGVSAAAIIYRAHERDFIDDARYRALQIQMSRWRRNEPGGFAPATGTLFARLVELHGGVKNVAKQLGVNPKHLGDVLNWSHLRLA